MTRALTQSILVFILETLQSINQGMSNFESTSNEILAGHKLLIERLARSEVKIQKIREAMERVARSTVRSLRKLKAKKSARVARMKKKAKRRNGVEELSH